MQPLEIEPQSKPMGEEVRSTKLEVGVEPQIILQNEST
jgi:hypothetical protein